VAAEAFRVLKPGGRIRIFSRSIGAGARGWLAVLEEAGFENVMIEGEYAVGVKP
jgi:hypothetical protein